jgi:hypothetical protein
LKEKILGQMNKTKNTCQLRHFEVPLAIHIIHEPFTMANKMLTKTSKICRPALRQKYTKILEELLLQTSQLQHGSESSGPNEKQCISSSTYSLCDVLVEGLRLDIFEEHRQRNDSSSTILNNLLLKWKTLRFGDSISCMLAKSSIKMKFDVDVSIDHLLATKGDFLSVLRLVHGGGNGGSGGSKNFSSSTIDWAAECELLDEDLALPSDVVDAVTNSSLSFSSPSITFITGATGFVGSALLREIAEKRTDNDIKEKRKYVCLVRISKEEEETVATANYDTIDDAEEAANAAALHRRELI